MCKLRKLAISAGKFLTYVYDNWIIIIIIIG